MPSGNIEKRYMLSYPASTLKRMVGFGILRLVDDDKLGLSTPVEYHERGGQTCQYAPSNPDALDPAPVAEGATSTRWPAGWTRC